MSAAESTLQHGPSSSVMPSTTAPLAVTQQSNLGATQTVPSCDQQSPKQYSCSACQQAFPKLFKLAEHFSKAHAPVTATINGTTPTTTSTSVTSTSTHTGITSTSKVSTDTSVTPTVSLKTRAASDKNSFNNQTSAPDGTSNEIANVASAVEKDAALLENDKDVAHLEASEHIDDTLTPSVKETVQEEEDTGFNDRNLSQTKSGLSKARSSPSQWERKTITAAVKQKINKIVKVNILQKKSRSLELHSEAVTAVSSSSSNNNEHWTKKTSSENVTPTGHPSNICNLRAVRRQSNKIVKVTNARANIRQESKEKRDQNETATFVDDGSASLLPEDIANTEKEKEVAPKREKRKNAKKTLEVPFTRVTQKQTKKEIKGLASQTVTPRRQEPNEFNKCMVQKDTEERKITQVPQQSLEQQQHFGNSAEQLDNSSKLVLEQRQANEHQQAERNQACIEYGKHEVEAQQQSSKETESKETYQTVKPALASVATLKRGGRPRKTTPAILSSSCPEIHSSAEPKTAGISNQQKPISRQPRRGRQSKCHSFDSSDPVATITDIVVPPVVPVTKTRRRSIKSSQPEPEIDSTRSEPSSKRPRRSRKTITQENTLPFEIDVLNQEEVSPRPSGEIVDTSSGGESHLVTDPPLQAANQGLASAWKRYSKKTTVPRPKRSPRVPKSTNGFTVPTGLNNQQVFCAEGTDTFCSADDLAKTTPGKTKPVTQVVQVIEVSSKLVRQMCASKSSEKPVKKSTKASNVNRKSTNQEEAKTAKDKEYSKIGNVGEHQPKFMINHLQDDQKQTVNMDPREPNAKPEKQIILQPSFMKSLMRGMPGILPGSGNTNSNTALVEYPDLKKLNPNLTITKAVFNGRKELSGSQKAVQNEIDFETSDIDIVEDDVGEEEDCDDAMSSDSDVECIDEDVSIVFSGGVRNRTPRSNITPLGESDVDSDGYSDEDDGGTSEEDIGAYILDDEEFSEYEDDDFESGVRHEFDHDDQSVIYGSGLKSTWTKKQSFPLEPVGFRYGRQEVLGNSFEFFRPTNTNNLDIVMKEVTFESSSDIVFPPYGPYLCEVCQTFVRTNVDYFHHLHLHLDVIDPEILKKIEQILKNEKEPPVFDIE